MKITEVVIRILRAAGEAAGFAFVALIRITRQRSEVYAFLERRAAAHPYQIDDAVVRQRDSNATVVSDAAGVSLVASKTAAVSTGVGGKEVPARRK